MLKFLSFLLSFPIALQAQSDFLKDPDIVWAAELEQDWVVDGPPFGAETIEGVSTLKLTCKELRRIYQMPPSLFQLVAFSAASGQIKLFKDPKCTISTNWESQVPDAPAYCFDPENYDEFGGIICKGFNRDEIKTWRLRQILTYHKRNAQWSTHVISIAPLALKRNEMGDSIGVNAMFWFRPYDLRPDIGTEAIVWAKKTINRQPKSKILANPNNLIKVIDGYHCPLEHLFKRLRDDMKTPFYNAWNEVPLTPEERLNATSPPSTMTVIFDPVTFEEKVVTTRDYLDPYSIQNLQLIQSWYWDKKHGRLSICLDAVAPIFEVWNEKTRAKTARTLFYRRAKH